MNAAAPRILIDRCVCLQVPFTRLLAQARAAGWDLATLGAETGCGNQCGLCRPYLREMLASGTTVFHEILVDREHGS